MAPGNRRKKDVLRSSPPDRRETPTTAGEDGLPGGLTALTVKKRTAKDVLGRGAFSAGFRQSGIVGAFQVIQLFVLTIGGVMLARFGMDGRPRRGGVALAGEVIACCRKPSGKRRTWLEPSR